MKVSGKLLPISTGAPWLRGTRMTEAGFIKDL
jgi:hypothetical protein